MTTQPQRPAPPAVSPAISASGPRRLPVNDLLHGADRVILVHQGQEYHLRVTRAGKLILTK